MELDKKIYEENWGRSTEKSNQLKMVVWQCWMNGFQRRYENIVIQKQLMMNKLHFSMNDW